MDDRIRKVMLSPEGEIVPDPSWEGVRLVPRPSLLSRFKRWLRRVGDGW